MLVFMVTSVIILYTTCKSSRAVGQMQMEGMENFSPANKRVTCVKKLENKTKDPRTYGGVYMGPINENSSLEDSVFAEEGPGKTNYELDLKVYTIQNSVRRRSSIQQMYPESQDQDEVKESCIET